jgi:hypothetical protein
MTDLTSGVVPAKIESAIDAHCATPANASGFPSPRNFEGQSSPRAVVSRASAHVTLKKPKTRQADEESVGAIADGSSTIVTGTLLNSAKTREKRA